VVDQQVSEQVRALVEALLAAQHSDLEVVDVEHTGSVLRVTIDRPTQGHVDLDTLSAVTRLISDALDRHDPVPGRYTLEVSSPGIERLLRTPAHFRRFVGTPVTVKLRSGVAGERRLVGTLDAADDEGIEVAGRRLRYDEIERARTRFDWEATPKPSRSTKKAKGPKGQAKGKVATG
jgi:ribosome maturation factor RimP